MTRRPVVPTTRSASVAQAAAPSHLAAVLQALFVTLLWSSSWVLIKVGLQDIPALTFAGLRYALAWLCVLPFALTPARRATLRKLGARDWAVLLLLGVLYYAVTQGTMFVGLSLLPAVTVSLILSFSPVAVALLSLPALGERLTGLQWAGAILSVAGVLLYFYPIDFPAGEVVGLLVVIAGMLTNAVSSIMGRSVNRAAVEAAPGERPDALTITAVSMGIGSLLLLIGGAGLQGVPSLSLQSWGIIAWLAVMNTAVAFTLWNHTLRTLSAMESSIINNTMLIQITLLAWLVLGEQISARQAIALAIAAVGALLVQLRRLPPLQRREAHT